MKIINKIKEHGIKNSFWLLLRNILKRIIIKINKKLTINLLKTKQFKNQDDYLKFSYEYLDLMQEKYEIKQLLEIIKLKKPKIILEIGSARGGTLFLFSKYVDKCAEIISIDLPNGSFGGGYKANRIPIFKKLITKKQNLHLIRADSHKKETLIQLLNILNDKQIDFLFIDGDHTYKGVKKDFEMYSSLVKKGGLIALHDIAIHPKETNCEVHRFWAEIKKEYKSKEIIIDKNQGWAGIGVIYK